MAETKKSVEVRDYKEPFEFRLTVGDNIICQRYFKINNFNPMSLNSFELSDAIRECSRIIDNDLKSKTQIYLELFSPRFFDSVEEMTEYFKNPNHSAVMHLGEGIVVKGSDVDYFWGNHGPEVCSYKFYDGELTSELTQEDRVQYKFAFLVEEREVNSVVWEGVYPKYIRNSIDLSNKRGKFEGEDLTKLSFEQYLLYKLVEGRGDLVWNLIREICKACSVQDNDDYTTDDEYSGVSYNNEYERYIQCIYEEQEREKRRQYRVQKAQSDKNKEKSVTKN